MDYSAKNTNVFTTGGFNYNRAMWISIRMFLEFIVSKYIILKCERTLQSEEQTLFPITNGVYKKLFQYEDAI